MSFRLFLLYLFAATFAVVHLVGFRCYAQDIPAIPRMLPPVGQSLPDEKAQQLKVRMRNLDNQNDPDIALFSKAVRFALLHDEFYKPGHHAVPDVLLAEAERRAADAGWAKQSSDSLVLGYRSDIDGSVQPYGLEIPENLDLTKPVPLWVWLHGRGDKETDLHFIHNRMRKRGQFRPENAIVLHPFGRQCVGWKWAGEVDVFEAIADVSKRYPIDPDRIALLGFSMGGAGAWHIGAHYADRFACVHAGAGFAETKEYIKLKPEDYPPVYEQTLWGIYDVPNYARNLLPLPVIAYSGEVDKQMQAARVMEAALLKHGKTLKHVIGAKMGHQYDKVSLTEVKAFVDQAVRKGRGGTTAAHPVSLQTRTLRYPAQRWITITGLEKHWEDSRVDSEITIDSNVQITTKNVTSLEISLDQWRPTDRQEGSWQVTIDGTVIPATTATSFVRAGDVWKVGKPESVLRKSPGLQGPIDDAFVSAFLFVTPIARSADPAVQRWVDFELAHQKARWRALFRAEPRCKPADEITAEDVQRYNLILWGDRKMNPLVGASLDAIFDVDWNAQSIQMGGTSQGSSGKVLTMIYPNPQNPSRYIVLNSGPTFREAHDRTNSLQNAKLPDWAVIDLATPPSASAPGAVIGAGFFNEQWMPQP